MPQDLKVKGPDGKTYIFPNDATDEDILGFFQPEQPKPSVSGGFFSGMTRREPTPDTRAVAMSLPVLTAAATGGASLPFQVGAQALAGGGQAAMQGGDMPRVVKGIIGGGLTGAVGGGGLGKLSSLMKFKQATPIMDQITEEVASPILNEFGRPFTNMVTRSVPRAIPEAAKSGGNAGELANAILGSVSPRMANQARAASIMGKTAGPGILSAIGSGLKSFQPGMPLSMSSLLALLNK